MTETRIQVEEGSRLTLDRMASRVTLIGWDEADVRIRLHEGEEKDLKVEQTETGPVVSARVACDVRVPASLPVTIRQAMANLKVVELSKLNAEQVRGNLKLSDVGEAVVAEVYGSLKASAMASLQLVGTVFGSATLSEVKAVELQNVRGNLRVKEAEQLRASRIGGNLQVKEMRGTLHADQVGGNAVLKGITGAVTLDQVAGNLVARELTGGAKVPKIGGNLVLNGDLGSGCTYHFGARGNATLGLSEDASAHLTLIGKGKLLTSVALADYEQAEGRLTGTLGDGGAEVVVEANGNLVLGGGRETAATSLGEEITRQVEEGLGAIDLEAIGQQVSEEMQSAMSRLRVKLESVDWERMGHRTQQAIDRAMDRMQRDLERMAEKTARQQERLERQAARQERREERLERRLKGGDPGQAQYEVEVDWEEWPVEDAPGTVPDIDEERLSILRMVEQGQITPVEAEMLLDALE
jgi:ribosome-associated translation inhibitor RaiA